MSLLCVVFRTPRKNTPDFKIYVLLFSHFITWVKKVRGVININAILSLNFEISRRLSTSSTLRHFRKENSVAFWTDVYPLSLTCEVEFQYLIKHLGVNRTISFSISTLTTRQYTSDNAVMEVFASLGLLMSGCIDWKHCSLCGIGVEDQCDNLLGIEVASFTAKRLRKQRTSSKQYFDEDGM